MERNVVAGGYCRVRRPICSKGGIRGYVMRAVGLRMMVRLRRSGGLPAVLADRLPVMMQIGV